MSEHSHPDPADAPPTEALARVARVSQEVVLRRLDVLRLEIEQRIDQVETQLAAGMGAAFLFATAWVLLCGAAVFALRPWVGTASALALIGAVSGLAGFAVLRAPRIRHGK